MVALAETTVIQNIKHASIFPHDTIETTYPLQTCRRDPVLEQGDQHGGRAGDKRGAAVRNEATNGPQAHAAVRFGRSKLSVGQICGIWLNGCTTNSTDSNSYCGACWSLLLVLPILLESRNYLAWFCPLADI